MSGIKLKKRLFGTNGVRGEVGKDMNPALAYAIGCALGTMRPGKVAVGRDTRTSGPNGCLQCHGSIIRFARDAKGQLLRDGDPKTGKPRIEADTWPNSGIGRLNPDGSKGSCHACHSRHSFEAKLSRSPENCGKCHMGPDHPQIEIYNESKHGIAFHANREHIALHKDGDWVLGRDYSAAPTCATCHISSYLTPEGEVQGNTHDVGERISWTLRPVISAKLNMVVFEDGQKEDYPESRPLPKVGETVKTTEKFVQAGVLASRQVDLYEKSFTFFSIAALRKSRCDDFWK